MHGRGVHGGVRGHPRKAFHLLVPTGKEWPGWELLVVMILQLLCWGKRVGLSRILLGSAGHRGYGDNRGASVGTRPCRREASFARVLVLPLIL
jgi:hypothetical protein